jgi:hypothetical protein
MKMTTNKLQYNMPQEAGEFPLPASGVSLECWLKTIREEQAVMLIGPVENAAPDVVSDAAPEIAPQVTLTISAERQGKNANH